MTTVNHLPLTQGLPLDSYGINRRLGQLDAVYSRFYAGTLDYTDHIDALSLPPSGYAHIYTLNGNLKIQLDTGNAPIGNAPFYACLRDNKPSGTNGGTFTSGAAYTRGLNEIVADDNDIVSLSSNQITLEEGVYRIYAAVPAYNVANHQATLYNITESEVTLYGTVEDCNSELTSVSIIIGEFTLTNTTVFEIQHECTSTQAANGYGRAGGWGDEIYTQLEIRKLDTA